MADPRHRGFARAFVLANRFFGWLAILAGLWFIVEIVIALVRGSHSFDDLWLAGVAAVLLVLIGVLYVRAPLFRDAHAGRANTQ